MRMFLQKCLKVNSRESQKGNLGVLFGDVGVCWALLGASCCSTGLHVEHNSKYPVFAVSDRHARKVRTGVVGGRFAAARGLEHQRKRSKQLADC